MPFCSRDDHLADVVQRTDEADAADVERLLAERQPLAADVLVGVRESRRQLVERHVVPAQPVGVDLDVVLLRVAAEPDDVDDARRLTELTFQRPVFGGLESLSASIRRREPRIGRPHRSRSTATAAASRRGARSRSSVD